MSAYRVSLHCRTPLRFAVERLNKHGRAVQLLGDDYPSLELAIDDAKFWGTRTLVALPALQAHLGRGNSSGETVDEAVRDLEGQSGEWTK